MAQKARDDAKAPFHNPFASLATEREGLPQGPPPKAPKAPEPPARAVVRLERKGRGGKEVTVVEKLELRPKELEAWAKALKQSLGCGGALEGGDIVLQGDQRDRVRAWLEGRGVRKISVG